jgi:chemotaxis methyl-accepting protein methylase
VNQTVGYDGYEAKRLKRHGPIHGALRGLKHFVKEEVVHGLVLYSYGKYRQKSLLRTASRSQAHTYTCFYRSPPQLRALVEAVVPFLRTKRVAHRPLTIHVFACSNGAEAYTYASVLHRAFPDLSFQICASDLHQEMVDQGTSGRYSKNEVLHSEDITESFIESTFDRDGEGFVVKPELRALVSFTRANLLAADLQTAFEPADIVVAQNVLFHLDPELARQAFANLAQLLKPRAALFIEGMDLDMKTQLTRDEGLTPLVFQHREIYQTSRKHMAAAWWRYYYGAEPYAIFRGDRVRRYSSIFLKGSDGAQ